MLGADLALSAGRPTTASGIPPSGGGGGVFANNYSLEFDGVDDGLLAGSAITLSGSSAWTVSFWAKDLTGSGSVRTYSVFNSESVLVPSGAGQFGFRLQYRYSNSDARATVYDDGSSIVGAYSTAMPPANWNHVAYTHDGSGTRKLYVNGSLQGTLTGKTNDFLSTGNWIFGKSGTDPLNMRFDEIAFIPSDLSGSMADLYNSGVAGDLSSYTPTNWWRMEDGSGSTVTDEGSAGNDATIQNQASFSTDVPS